MEDIILEHQINSEEDEARRLTAVFENFLRIDLKVKKAINKIIVKELHQGQRHPLSVSRTYQQSQKSENTQNIYIQDENDSLHCNEKISYIDFIKKKAKKS